MAVSAPSYTNVFVPKVTENLIVDYSRNWKDFPVNMLATTTPVDQPIGYFQRISPDSQARDGALETNIWYPGSPRPVQTNNQHEFDFVKFFCQPYSKTAVVPYAVQKNASYDVEAKYARDLANKLMLQRARKFYSVLSDSNNHLSGHVDTAANWGGAGTWSTSSTTNRYIQKSLMAVARKIVKDSVNSGVKLSDLFLVIGPEMADLMARSPEISDYIKGAGQAAAPYLEFKLWAEQNALYGLPQVLYGMKVVVDETVSDTAKIGETSNKTFLPGTSSAYVITKKNWQNESPIATQFSSIHFFVDKNDEMKTEVFDEPMNRRQIVALTDSWECQLVSRETSAVITSIS